MKGDKEIVCGSPSFAIYSDDERDARRYRWLREAGEDRLVDVVMEFGSWQREYQTPAKFDEEVDRAMQQSTKRDGNGG